MKKNKLFLPPFNYDNSVYTIDGVVPLNLFLGGTNVYGSPYYQQ